VLTREEPQVERLSSLCDGLDGAFEKEQQMNASQNFTMSLRENAKADNAEVKDAHKPASIDYPTVSLTQYAHTKQL
jgi:hypothetical protein